MTKRKTACFSGYRPEKFPFPLETGCEAYVNLQADITLAIGLAVKDGYVRFLSGMAGGFDLVCAGMPASSWRRFCPLPGMASKAAGEIFTTGFWPRPMKWAPWPTGIPAKLF